MTYKIPVIYQNWGIIKVEAESLEEAIEQVKDGPLPRHAEYISDSMEIDYDGIPLHNAHI